MKAVSVRQQGWWALAALTMAALLMLGLMISLAVSIGEVAIPLATTAEAVSNRLFGTDFELSRIHQGIVWDYRLSRALVAASAGASLSLSGAILQALLRNPLAEPYVLGISAGASTGAVCVMILGFGYGVLGLSSGAFIGAVIAFLLVGILATGAGGTGERIILCGVAGSQLFNALTSYIVTTSANAEQARGILFWLLGSLSGVRWPDVYLSVPIALAGFVICMAHVRALDAFAFGTDAAASLGIAVRRVQIVLFAMTAAMTASVVSMVGSIGFVGLVIPHAARFLVGPAHRRLLPATALGGAIYMVGADIISRIIIPQQILPIGVVTALFGAPAFAVILYRVRGKA
ncbi:iron ABC transporter permease [Rhizobium leguminosarum]|uniref:FecCD family ABC transporter permease n=1 Tax=Rhizobium TaxID=379 RepID=UPI0005A53789|nr:MULTISPECIES: iron ABC transporter permease [Rhizobium]MBY5372431.1 iron ABC transporter permease [Rhizobium leguminosarum]NEH96791.1 iron chelate uptake ABC transporter family permease subunit [Rhizobium leguminosarum]NEI89638.1 iron chelate uptake ABC transporter family permease subunit [Rhizobium leguminosarum]NEJ46240.1 iron chelate uptake ABC transporter family permease subunit [Rhizobium leguminosarum]NEJ50299.1 iron chelate uptake ABC transporter family permease subunit [Rhizobium le